MKVLVLGGTHHVGRAVVEAALVRGDKVTTLNRGISGVPVAGVEEIFADRMNRDAVSKAIGDRTWDAVIDTWAWEPRVVQDTVELLADRVNHYGYVSSRGVYQWPWPSNADENAPLVNGNPFSENSENYAEAKRGCEISVINTFKENALIARPGMILGPYEDVGRIPWWMRRLERNGRVLAPGPVDTPLQYIDAHDLALWMLSCAERDVGGTFNVACEPHFTTVGELLYTIKDVIGSDTELVWADPDLLEREDFMLGMEFGLRYPGLPKPSGLHDANVTAAHQAGLTIRPLRKTLAETWKWLYDEGNPKPRPDSPSLDSLIDPAKEKIVINKITQF
ncbi:NAD-dependent epimerase/dehydratase family protein [Natribacillus halophilus]|uniref:Nucleoside-diphosphate-sugar epimerase n=1 Tax=Natribacillus halophilus TaxID=549003 RepID=A0A1G8Q0U0_9BACI|nr:NAD-dependent epimerase/dehydratase family protein [Natribacillus halophilus]SDI98075.1 Nucleoside-diphosphate-sugar epimerase [Natribacillus halophilus]